MKKLTNGLLTLFLAFVVQFTFAQEKEISGTISDEDGLPLPGVNIIIKGSASGTQTDFDGNYKLNASTGDVLAYSYVGYKTVEKTVGASNKISFGMEIDAQAIETVVVTALGIKREEKALGYATQQVKSEELTQVRDANIVNSLSGKIAGINVTNSSGAVGSSSRIVIRGISTISGNTQPLVVVDGVVMDNGNYGSSDAYGGNTTPNGLADINQDDIESINVLKGGAATSLYGMRGSNGVLVITTKSGKSKSKKLGIDITSAVSFENAFILPNYQNSYGQGDSPFYFEFVDGITGSGGVDESWGPALDKGLEFIQWNSFNGEALPWVSRPDNIKNFYETGITTNNNISFSKSSEKQNSRMSIGLTDQKGILYNTDLRKFNIGGRTDFQLSDKWNAGVSINYIKSESANLPSVGYGDPNNVIGQLVWAGRNVDINALKNWRNLPSINAAGTTTPTPINWNMAYNNNPYWTLDTNTNPFNRNRFLGNINLGYKISPKLTVTAQTGIDFFSSLDSQKRAFGTYQTPRGSFKETQRTRYEINTQAILSYDTKIGEKFRANVSAGGNMMTNDFHRLVLEASELQVPDLYNISNIRDGVSPTLEQKQFDSKINSVFGFGQLSYNDYLFLDVTARNDWASVLPINNNSFFYPSVTLSAILSDILKTNKEYVSYLKLRGGWSKVGSAGPLRPYRIAPSFAYSVLPVGNSDGPWATTPIAEFPNELWNPNIKNEDTEEVEVGLESRFFSSRLRLDVTYYDKQTSDVIMRKQIDAASGNGFFWDNAATISNKGIEASLGGDIIKKENGFNLGLTVNFAKNKNVVDNIDDDPSTQNGSVNLGRGLWNVTIQAREGEAVGAIFGPAFRRDKNGEVIYVNGLPQIDETFKVLGNINPDWTGGLGINMSYKGFKFSTLFDVKKGGDIYSQTNTWGKYAGVLDETLLGRETGIVGDGVIVNADGETIGKNNVVVPGRTYFKSAFSQNIAESSVYDASFVKWREAALSYELPKKLIQNTGLNSMSLGVTVRNLAILYKVVPHVDPESAFSTDTAGQGLEFAQIPSTRSVGFNLNLKF